MTKLVALDRAAHKTLKVQNDKALAHCARLHMVTVVASEISKLVIQYPVVFTRSPDNKRYVCVALFGLEPEQNLFWRNNQWEGVCMPLNIVRQPFFVGFSDNNNPDPSRMVALIDMDNEGVQQEQGEALFDEKGEQTGFLKRKLGALAELMQFEPATQKFIEKLEQLELITPLRLSVRFPNEEQQRTITGLFTIHEEKLRGLSRDALGELHSQGFLAPTFAMLFSLGHIYSLLQRRNELTAPAERAAG